MIWVCGPLIVLEVAGDTGCAAQVVVVIDVAIGALARRYGVHAGQREGCQRMIKRGIRPGHGVVALIAGLGEGSGDVIGICGRLIILQVATHAGRTSDVVVVVDVTVGALPRRHGVTAGQRESDGGVIESGVEPVVSSVAILAGNGKIGANVVGAARRLEIARVARKARRGHGLKLAAGSTFVAGIAVQSCVGPG